MAENKVVVNNYDIVKTEIEGPTTVTPTTKWTTTRILIIVGVSCSVIALAVGLGVGLGMKKTTSGTELNIPYLKPPVVSASPQGLKARRRLRTDNDNINRNLVASTIAESAAITTIKTRLFQEGPGDFSWRLGMVDQRLQEFKTRAKESDKECLSTIAVKFEPTLPNNEAFPMYFSCKEEMSSQLSVYFGQKDGLYYVAELQKGGTDAVLGYIPTIAVLASVDSAGNKVDVWQIAVEETANPPKTVSVFHIMADKLANTIQVIAAATSTGTGIGCGIKMSSTASALMVYGYPGDNNSPSGNLCPTDTNPNDYINSVVTGAGNWDIYCVNPDTLTTISPNTPCTSLLSGFPLADFSYANLVTTTYANSAYSLIFSPSLPDGLVDFKKSA